MQECCFKCPKSARSLFFISLRCVLTLSQMFNQKMSKGFVFCFLQKKKIKIVHFIWSSVAIRLGEIQIEEESWRRRLNVTCEKRENISPQKKHLCRGHIT